MYLNPKNSDNIDIKRVILAPVKLKYVNLAFEIINCIHIKLGNMITNPCADLNGWINFFRLCCVALYGDQSRNYIIFIHN